MKKFLLLLTLVGALVLSGCGGSTAGAQTVDPSTFLQTTSQPGTTVIDVRTADEYAAGHLEGAVNIDVERADFQEQIAALDKSKAYAVYCHSGRRSAIAAGVMSDAGFTSVTNLKGGLTDLLAAGGRMEAP